MANKDYIANVLCINKYKPMMNCKGKCYLKKQLAQQDTKECNAAVSGSTEIPLFYAPALSLSIPLVVSSVKDVSIAQPSSEIFPGISTRIFQPPQLIARFNLLFWQFRFKMRTQESVNIPGICYRLSQKH